MTMTIPQANKPIAKLYTSVVDFHKTFLPAPPAIFDTDCLMRHHFFLHSEFIEYQEAKTRAEKADAILDMLYFSLGACYQAKKNPVAVASGFGNLEKQLNLMRLYDVLKAIGELDALYYPKINLMLVFLWHREFPSSDLMKNFIIVHQANMLKACETENQAKATANKYQKIGIETTTKYINKHFVVSRSSDGKVLKNYLWEPPILEL